MPETPAKPDTPVTLTHQAIALRAADPAAARGLLGVALAEDAEYEPAWRWLAELVADDAERLFCLDRAYVIKADPATDRARRALRGVEPQAPPEARDVVEPPRPDPVDHAPKRRTKLKGLLAAGVVVLVAVTDAGVWTAVGQAADTPVHVALVVGLTGRDPAAAAHVERGVRMGLEDVNAAGGVDGHPVELLVYDDADQPERAERIAEEIVREDRALYVIGHGVTVTSLAAAPIYRAAGIPAVTPSASGSSVTDSSDWYFRSMFGDRTQGDFLAVYAARVLGAREVAVIHDDHASGRSAQAAFTASYRQFGEVVATVAVTDDPRPAIDRIKALPPGTPVLLATEDRNGVPLVKGLREAGVTAPILGTASLGTTSFHDALGGATRDLHLATPMAHDSLSGPALAWAEDYRRRYGERPRWHAATAREALNVGLHVVTTGRIGLDETTIAEDRGRLRDGLAALKDKKNAFPALLGPLYFTANGSAQMPVSFVTSDGTRLVSAPVQLTVYEPPSPQALGAAVADGTVIPVGDRYLTRRQVVATGINLNEVRDLDTRDGTYFVDFFLWLKYTGPHTAADVQFVNAVEPDLELGEPLRDVTDENGTYRLYRVADRFKNGFEFRSFPFDHQHLEVVLQNRTRTADEVVYVTDKEVLDQPAEHHLRSGADAEATINAIPNWLATSARFFQRTVGSSDALGDGSAAGVAEGIYYSQYTGEVEIVRDTLPFLLKNLLPLLLLICVTYLSLFFKAADGAAPVSMGVTAILSTAVLLTNVTSQLPSVSYTVALEWGYYAFILLAVGCVLVAMLRKRLASVRRDDAERRLARASRVGYPVYLLAVLATYLVAFA
ncbi:ABC transporter substrate-binding protein [Saccharothrix texasensis]|uniref:ABC-type branched-subunit amino acid transport system substrate-binding protein n=1 Tax=Saccharothrix texasensis TaxID=103734 RepID=A0A3N1H1P2_9PSEU|nr:ABC transporter substrate-binding protein [Saccharothrix texasensis]ROP36451.1 ABC-type branched-subunit amino acid transport system substrate-binding protein [Saccharothrix texasensis]